MSKVNLEKLKKEMNKKFGAEVAKTGGDIPQKVDVWCSTGSFSLDLIIGCGGIPKNRMISLQGPSKGGKTTLSLIMMGTVQNSNPDNTVGFIDLEGTYTHDWASKLGVNLDNLIYVRTDNGNDALESLQMMVENNVSFIIMDSVSCLVTKAEEEADMDQSQMAQLARLLGRSLKKLTAKMSKSDSTICFINQVRANITSMGAFGVKGTGGNAFLHAMSLILNVTRQSGGHLGDNDNPIGFKTDILVKENKVGPPLRKITVDLYIDGDKIGIDKEAEVMDVAIQLNIIERQKKEKNEEGIDIYKRDPKGNHYQYKEERFYGKPKMVEYIESDENIKKELQNLINETMKKKDKPAEDSFKAKIKGE